MLPSDDVPHWNHLSEIAEEDPLECLIKALFIRPFFVLVKWFFPERKTSLACPWIPSSSWQVFLYSLLPLRHHLHGTQPRAFAGVSSMLFQPPELWTKSTSSLCKWSSLGDFSEPIHLLTSSPAEHGSRAPITLLQGQMITLKIFFVFLSVCKLQ